MEWYYAQGKEPRGPVSEEAFQELVHNGTIVSETLVWNQSMTDWTAYRFVRNGKAAMPTAVSGPVNASRKACSECGGVFSEQDMMPFNELWVCAACKPLFIQKLKEGVPVGNALEFSGFWLRFGAWVIDYIIMMVVQMVIYIPFTFFGMMNMLPNMSDKKSPDPSDIAVFMAITAFMWVLQISVAVGYETWFVGKYQATPGKMACQIKVVNSDGGRVSYLKACGRHFAKWISYFILGIGFIMAAFDDQKRGLHDHICNTRVVRKQ